MENIHLSPSQIIDLGDCRMKHAFKSVYKIKSKVLPANLAYGTVIDRVIRDYLFSLTSGNPIDPVKRFINTWHNTVKRKVLSYSSTRDESDFETFGIKALEAFPDFWHENGYSVATGRDGKLLMNVRLQVKISGHIILTGIIDLILFDRDFNLGIKDLKTAVQDHSKVDVMLSDQLTAYDLLCRTHSNTLGIPFPEFIGFIDIRKLKTKASIKSVTTHPRTSNELNNFVKKIEYYAQDIREKRFYRESRASYNSPCNTCEFTGLCTSGNCEGLIIPTGTKLPIAA